MKGIIKQQGPHLHLFTPMLYLLNLFQLNKNMFKITALIENIYVTSSMSKIEKCNG